MNLKRSPEFIQCYQEKIQQPPLQHSALLALRQLCMYLMTFQIINTGILKCADISGIRLLLQHKQNSHILFTWYHHKMSCRHKSPRCEFTPVVAPGREFHSGRKSRNSKRETTRYFGGKSVCWWTGKGSACVMVAILNHTYILLTWNIPSNNEIWNDPVIM